MTCLCLTREDMGPGVPIAYADWMAADFTKRCPEHRYGRFLAGKRMTAPSSGIHVEPEQIHPSLFPFQRDMTRWALLGLGDSYEQYYQSIRRCYRFGQQRPVTAHVVLSEPEEEIFANVLRKEADAEEMARELVKHVAAFERAELGAAPLTYDYHATKSMEMPSWL